MRAYENRPHLFVNQNRNKWHPQWVSNIRDDASIPNHNQLFSGIWICHWSLNAWKRDQESESVCWWFGCHFIVNRRRGSSSPFVLFIQPSNYYTHASYKKIANKNRLFLWWRTNPFANVHQISLKERSVRNETSIRF